MPRKVGGYGIGKGMGWRKKPRLNPAPTTPEWLPEGAFLFAKPSDGQYFGAGEEQTKATFFTEDLLNWGSYSSESLVTSITAGNSPVINPSFLAPVGDSATIVLDFEQGDGPVIVTMIGSDYLPEVEAKFEQNGSGRVRHFRDGSILEITLENGTVSQGVHRVAYTFSRTKIAYSLDGGAAVSQSGPDNDAGPIGIFGLVGWQGSKITRVVGLAAVADADLPALSAL